MSNFISRLLKGTAGISQNNSFECQSFVEVNPTVNRRSTDSHSQRDYKAGTLSFRHITQRLPLFPRLTRLFPHLTRLTRLAALLTLLLTLGIGNALADCAYHVTGGYIYLDATAPNWTESYIYLGHGHDDKFPITRFSENKISGTNLYWINNSVSESWASNVCYLMFFAAGSSWPSAKNYDDVKAYAPHYSGKSYYSFDANSTYLVILGAGNDNMATISYHSSGISDFNHAQTVKKYTYTYNLDAGTQSYTNSKINSGTITISAYQMTAQGEASNEDNSDIIDEASELEASVDAAYTGEVEMTATAAEGYYFVGWYSSSGTLLESSTTYRYNAPNSTNEVHARFAPSLKRTLYLNTQDFNDSGTKNWTNDNAVFFAKFMGNSEPQYVEFNMTPVATNYYAVTTPEGDWSKVQFLRVDPNDKGNLPTSGIWNQSAEMTADGVNNCACVSGWNPTGSWTLYSPLACIIGSMNNYSPDSAKMSFTGDDGTVEIQLEAHKTYEFKVLDGTDRRGLTNNVWTSSVSNYDTNNGQYQIRLCTAGKGKYRFDYNKSNHKLSVTYPTVSHPSADYCYLHDYTASSWSNGAYIHFKDPSTSDNIAGTTWQGTQIHNKVEISGTNYFYYSPGDYPYLHLHEYDDENDQTKDQIPSYGKYLSWNECTTSAWGWCTFTVRIQLDDLTATTHVDPTYQDVAFNSAVLTDLTTVPEKTHYDFGGFYTGYDSENNIATGTQVIDADGNWIAGVTDYTDEDKHWIHAGTSTTLYAMWTEHEYAVTISVTGSGSTSPANSTTAKYVTESGNITATPSTGWHFRDWAFTQTEGKDDIWCAYGYSSTNATIHIKAQHDGTLTAHFDPTSYVVRLEDKGADEGHKGTPNVSVTYGTTTGLTSAIECPQKNHYDFGGYWISSDGGTTLTTQLINADGTWKKNISGYTGASEDNPTWVCAGDTVLYAKWTEHEYSIALSVSPAGAGSISPASPTTGTYETESGDITAAANAGWKFKEWQFTKTDEQNDMWCATGYSSLNATIHIKAQHDGTLTAVFEPRYYLVGGEYKNEAGVETDTTTASGMPGWGVYTAPFIVTSTSPLLATCERTLANADKTYKFLVLDKNDGTSYGVNSSSFEVIEDNENLVFDDANCKVYLYAKGGTTYTFKIDNTDASGHPYVSLDRPQQVNFGQKYKDIDGKLRSGTTGGTASATAGEDVLTSGDYVTYNTEVTHNESAATGYTFAGWWSTDAFTGARFSNVHPMPYNVTSQDNAYALFTEDSTHVHFANDGHGHVTIGGETRTDTIVGITTHRTLVAVPNAGYKFSSWDKTSGSDYDLTSTSTATTTLSGKGEGATSGQTITANFNERWSIKGTMNGEDWGTSHTISNIGTNANSKDTGYVEMILPANTTYEFAIYDEQTGGWLKNGIGSVFNMTYAGNHANWHFGRPNQNHNCGITTAGAGTYRFIFNITDTTVTVIYPTSYLVNLGMKAFSYEGTEISGISCTVTATDLASVNYTNGQYIAKDATVSVEATSIPTGYHFVGWHNNSSYNSQFSNTNPTASWTVTEAVNAYAKITEDAIAFTDASNDHKWSTTSNWSGGEIPTINEVAIIQKPVVVDITDAKAKRVILDQYSHTGSLEIPAGKELIVAETVKKYDGSSYGATDEDDIFIGSNSTNGLGALVMGNHNNGNKATISFYSKASYDAETPAKSVNQYVGLPFTSGTVLGCFYDSWVYEITYPNNVPTWSRISGSMNPWIGYSIIYNGSAGHSYWMDGTLVATTNTTCSSLHNADATGASNWNNENLLANSWTAPIKINAMQAGDFTNTTATIYIFNSGSPNDYKDADKTGSGAAQYSTYTIGTAGESDIIPSMQSFSVFTTEADASVALNYERLVYTPAVDGTTPAANRAPQRRVLGEETNKMHLYVHGESGYGDMVYLLSRSDFENGFENGWDGHKLFGESVAPQMYAITPDGNMAINCVPTMEGTVLGFQKGSGDSEYAFSFDYEGLETLYLNDLKAQVSTLIDATNIYTFTAAADDDEARFIISATPIGQMPTEVETPSGSPSRGEKILINGQLYIIRHGRMYSAEGCLIK